MPLHQTTIVLNDKECPAVIEYCTDYPVVGDRSLIGIKNVLISINSIKPTVQAYQSKQDSVLKEIGWLNEKSHRETEIDLFNPGYDFLLSDELISELESEIKEYLIAGYKSARWSSLDLAV